jgi:hypothetical protein
MIRRLSGSHENCGVPPNVGRLIRMRRGGVDGLAGYGKSHASSAVLPLLRKNRICFPSGENFNVGALTKPRITDGSG